MFCEGSGEIGSGADVGFVELVENGDSHEVEGSRGLMSERPRAAIQRSFNIQ